MQGQNVEIWLKVSKVQLQKMYVCELQGYINQMNHYIQHGDWCCDFYGEYEEKRIIWKTIDLHTRSGKSKIWKKVVEQKIDKDIDVREDLKMIAEMHKVILHQMIFTLRETGFDIESDEFIKESGFMGEVIRATLMRSMGYSNPMSNFINHSCGY